MPCWLLRFYKAKSGANLRVSQWPEALNRIPGNVSIMNQNKPSILFEDPHTYHFNACIRNIQNFKIKIADDDAFFQVGDRFILVNDKSG